MKDNSMIIEIQPNAVQLTTVKNGVKSIKMTDLRSVQEVLTKETALETPFLPGPWGVRKYMRKNDRELTVFTTPPHVRKAAYDWREEGIRETRTYDIAYPALCWFISTIVRPGQETRQYLQGMVKAMKDPLYTETQPMYQFPFSNVDGHWMCWGGNNVELGNLASLTSIPDRFLDMKYNNHLDYDNYNIFEREVKGQKIKASRCTHLLEHLDSLSKAADEEGTGPISFPVGILKKQDSFKEELQRSMQQLR